MAFERKNSFKVRKFEEECGVTFKKDNIQELKLLIGSQPYLRNIRISSKECIPIRVSMKDFSVPNITLDGNITLKVEKSISLATSNKTLSCKYEKLKLILTKKEFFEIYKDFEEIAFLTNRWKDVSLSLVKILSLMFNSEEAALKAIVYFRENDVSTFDFARYLYEEHSTLLINTFSYDEMKDDSINKKRIKKISKHSMI